MIRCKVLRHSLVILFAAILFTCFLNEPVQGQQLRLPNLFPFKKKNREVQPIPLSDQNGHAGQARNGLGLMQGRDGNGGPLSNFNQRSRKFFADAGQGFSRFADDTRRALSESWNPPKAHRAWWNQGPKDLPGQALLNWNRQSPETQLPPMQRPETAQQYRNGAPARRF